MGATIPHEIHGEVHDSTDGADAADRGDEGRQRPPHGRRRRQAAERDGDPEYGPARVGRHGRADHREAEQHAADEHGLPHAGLIHARAAIIASMNHPRRERSVAHSRHGPRRRRKARGLDDAHARRADEVVGKPCQEEVEGVPVGRPGRWPGPRSFSARGDSRASRARLSPTGSRASRRLRRCTLCSAGSSPRSALGSL